MSVDEDGPYLAGRISALAGSIEKLEGGVVRLMSAWLADVARTALADADADPDTISLSLSSSAAQPIRLIGGLASLLESVAELEAAEMYRRREVAACEAHHGVSATETLLAVQRLSKLLYERGLYEEAEASRRPLRPASSRPRDARGASRRAATACTRATSRRPALRTRRRCVRRIISR